MGFFSGILRGGILGGLAGSAVKAVGGPLGAALGAVGGFFGQRERHRASVDAWNRSSDMTWRLWHAQNSYNDPAAQMQRFKAAGLNPNLIYGHMSNSPAPSFVRSEPEETSDFLEQLRYLQGFDLQERQLGMQIMNSAANLELAKQNSIRQDRELALREDIRPLEKELLRARIDAMKNQNEYSVGGLLGDILKVFGYGKIGKVAGKVVDNIPRFSDNSKPWWKFW